MKTKSDPKNNHFQFAGFFMLAFFLLPLLAFSQKKIKKVKQYEDITIILDCVEYIGLGKYRAYFGYDNPNKDEIDVPQENSVIIKLRGNDYGHRNFKPGRQYKVF